MSREYDQREAPILARKDYATLSIFTPQNLLREARRQKGFPDGRIPAICVLDPDGDLLDYLQATRRATQHPTWACYHTTLYTVGEDGWEFGIIGRAVGAPFAVLVAEELFASGCQLLISITSAGQLMEVGQPPYVVLIDRALRDEGTSYHYLSPAPYSHLPPALSEMICAGWDHTVLPLHVGASWTTDAPFRETETMIAWGREQGLLAIEMEAAALYALAEAKQFPIVCFAHVTNQMAQVEGDFEKGIANGSVTAFLIIQQTAHNWLHRHRSL
ncbi:MAG: nucleoside phosphorylase [Ktedonobacteraceae bacterium]